MASNKKHHGWSEVLMPCVTEAVFQPIAWLITEEKISNNYKNTKLDTAQ